jgi:hypothetical protein
VDGPLASAAGFVNQILNLVTVFVLCAFLGLGLRLLALLFLDPGRSAAMTLGRIAGGLVMGGLGAFYAVFTLPRLEWNGHAIAMAAALLVILLLSLALRRPDRAPRRSSVSGYMSQSILILLLFLVATLTLMRAGFLSLTEDRPVLLVDVTGETRAQEVAWAPPDQPSRRESLTTHRVVFRTPEGDPVAEAWVYGDQVAVKGRALRLSPVLNAAGITNLFELQFAHNGYTTATRHATYPHQAVPLPCTGPLAVHPWWRPVQMRILAYWEKSTQDSSPFVIRSATTESTYFPLVEPSGQPVKRSFRVVLTPGGLTAS